MRRLLREASGDDLILYALQLPAGSTSAAVLSASNKALLLISMLLAAIAVVSAFAVQDRTALGQVLSSLFVPVSMLTALVR
jgi:branched-subunit amino acid transport protein